MWAHEFCKHFCNQIVYIDRVPIKIFTWALHSLRAALPLAQVAGDTILSLIPPSGLVSCLGAPLRAPEILLPDKGRGSVPTFRGSLVPLGTTLTRENQGSKAIPAEAFGERLRAGWDPDK